MEEKTKFKELTPEEQNARNEMTKAKQYALWELIFRAFWFNLDQVGKLILFLAVMFFSYWLFKIKLGMSNQEIRFMFDDWLYLIGSGAGAVATFVGTSFIPQGRLSGNATDVINRWKSKKNDEVDLYGRSIAGKQK